MLWLQVKVAGTDLCSPGDKGIICAVSLSSRRVFERCIESHSMGQQSSMSNHDAIVHAESFIKREMSAHCFSNSR